MEFIRFNESFNVLLTLSLLSGCDISGRGGGEALGEEATECSIILGFVFMFVLCFNVCSLSGLLFFCV